MSANITFNSRTGLYEVMTRGAAWHNLGQVVQEAKTWQETAVLAGLNWTISKRQLEFNGQSVPVYGIFRDDLIHADLSKAFLASATEGYTPIQNEFMFAFLDTMVEADGKAHYESAGSLNGGRQVFAMVHLGTAFEIGNSGDRFETYLVFLEDRTGTRAAKCFITTVRVVCANTFEMAYAGADDAQTVKFRHTKNIHAKMVEAAGMFTGARMTVEVLREKLQRLAERKLTRATMVELLDALFPAETKEQANSKQRQDKIVQLLGLYGSNDGNMFPETKGTAYNLFNAVTEQVDHFAKVKRTDEKANMTDQQIRSERAMFGSGAEYKGKVLDLILEKTAYEPTVRKAYSVGGVQVLETEKVKTQAENIGGSIKVDWDDLGITPSNN